VDARPGSKGDIPGVGMAPPAEDVKRVCDAEESAKSKPRGKKKEE